MRRSIIERVSGPSSKRITFVLAISINVSRVFFAKLKADRKEPHRPAPFLRERSVYPDSSTRKPANLNARRMLFCGVVSAQTEKVVEFFLERKEAEAMMRKVREDEPVLAEDLRVEAIELE
jgi:hypothetical protein